VGQEAVPAAAVVVAAVRDGPKGELRPEHVGTSVRLSGWVHRKRDHGQLLFIDLRDHFGITQIVFQASFEKILGLTDLFLFDLKLMDDAAHQRFTGVSNQLILENLRRLSAATDAIFIRFPVVPTINDGVENIRALIALLRELRFRQINLLPYHELGRSKAARLGRSYPLPGIRPPSPEQLETLRAELAAAGFPTVIGG
jgi:hypothetical protein